MTKKTLCFILAACLLLAVPALAAGGTGLRTSEAGIAFIKDKEGFSAQAYEDSTGWAIGYGTRCQAGQYPDGITEAQADALLRGHLAETEGYIDKAMSALGVTLNQHQYDALASLSYNIGVGWLTSSYRLYNMLAAGIQYYTDEEIDNTFARYSNSAAGGTLDALVERRLEEALIFLYGDYGFGGTPLYEYEYKELEDDDYELFHRVWEEYSPAKFSDVPYSQWYYQYVSPLACAGIMDGYEDGSFRPSGNITAGEALKLVLLAAGYPAQERTGAHWASGYLDLALSEGILSEEDVSSLDAPVTRLFIAKLAARALRLETYSSTYFSDTSDGYVGALFNVGVIEGSTSGGEPVYLPDNNINRAEMSAVVWRIYNLDL